MSEEGERYGEEIEASLEETTPERKLCPYSLAGQSPLQCVGEHCELWQHYEIHRPDGVEAIEGCVHNVQARFGFQQMGALMQIQSQAAHQSAQRIVPAGVHPGFRG